MPTTGGNGVAPPVDKLVIFDDDICFGALLSAKARTQGFEPRFFTSLLDMGSFARIKTFDIAIVDYYLGAIQGDEIAEYVDTFFNQVPVIIVSAEDLRESKGQTWPASVRQFVLKAEGPGKIIEAARNVLQRERMLRRLAATGRGDAANRTV